jgi:hypothetical protein
MKPLHVAVLTKATSPNRFDRINRSWGLWTYDVPEFTWEIMPTWKWEEYDTERLKAGGFDLAFLEDGAWAKFEGDAIPTAFYIVDSTVSEDHYRQRLNQCPHVDLLLLDHDRPERFEMGIPVRQLSHCVNDTIFKDYGQKQVDIASHMNTGGVCEQGRKELGRVLREWCKERGYSYRGGTLGTEHYARSLSEARIAVNWPRNPNNRSHRVLDGMACRSCLVTGPVPDVPGEIRVSGRDYVQAADFEEFFYQVSDLLDNKRWREIADNGYECIQKHHTWRVRAGQLRQILNEEIGI